MSKGKKFFVWTLIVAGILVLVYFGLQKENVSNLSFGPGFDSFREKAAQKTSETAESLKEDLNEKFGAVKEKVAENLSEAADKAIESGKETILEKAKETIKEGAAKAFENIGEFFGVSREPVAEDSFIEYFSYLTKVKVPLSFVLKNPFGLDEPKILDYLIDWGDGQEDEGKVLTGQNVVISHVWQEKGEYPAKFTVISGESDVFDYQIKILATE